MNIFAGASLDPKGTQMRPQNSSSRPLRVFAAKRRKILPGPGEDPPSSAVWHVHAQCRVVELVAGYMAERQAGHAGDGGAGSTDLQLARIYAATICQPGAINAYLEFARQQASEILKSYWPAVETLAQGLDCQGTMAGDAIDLVISRAEGEAAHCREMARQGEMADAACRAAAFLERFNGERLTCNSSRAECFQ
jgi:hypothetical protein